MTQSLSSTKDRLAQSLYVVGASISIGLLVICAAFTLTLIEQLIDQIKNPRRTYGSRATEGATLTLVFALIAYGVGWGLRWVINGTTKSIIDYLRDPMRILKNPFVMATFAVTVLFSIILPYLGVTTSRGNVEAQFFEGIGAALLVLLLSCVGLLFRARQGLAFVIAALGFSALLIISRVYSPF